MQLPAQIYEWTWVAGLVIAVASPLLLYLLIGRYVARGMAKRPPQSLYYALLSAARGAPLTLLFLTAIFLMVRPFLAPLWRHFFGDMGIDTEKVWVLVVVAIGHMVVRLTGWAVNTGARHRVTTTAGADPSRILAIKRLLQLAIALLFAFPAMRILGIDPYTLLAFGGMGGLAVGLAAKDTLANFFSGFSIQMENLFAEGEWIRSPDKEIEGVVEEIGWRVTRIRTFTQRPLYVPNSLFASIVVENPSRMHGRRISEIIGLRYEDFDKVEAIVVDVRKMLENHPAIVQDALLTVHFDRFSDSSLHILLQAFTQDAGIVEYRRLRQEILLAVGGIVTAHGAEFAFPTQTLHLAGYTGDAPALRELNPGLSA